MTSSTEVKHTLTADGAPFYAQGNPVNSDSSTKGEGSAKCACSWLSEVLPSRAARKAAHAEHRTNPTPVEPIKEKKPVAKKTTTEEPTVEADESAEPTKSVTIEYAGAAKHFWRSLSKGAIDYVGRIEGVVDATADYKTRTLTVEATVPEALEQAQAQVPQLWADAYAAMKEARKTDEGLAVAQNETTEQRYARYKNEQAWMLAFCEKYTGPSEDEVL